MPLPDRFDSTELDRLRSRLVALPRRRLRAAPSPREAAVLVSLCHIDGEAGVLFTKRSDKVGTHKGQVSFPGGMADEDDEGPAHTALRELEEEIGLSMNDIEVLGLFHEAQAITGVRVVPVVGFLGDVDLGALTISEAEIDEVFALRFEELLDDAQRFEKILGERGPHPVFVAGPHPVWGLTAWILREVLEDLFDVRLGPGHAEPVSLW
jgi:nudix motif 8